MKIMMISSFLPFPLYSGGQVRLFNLIKELSKKHEITLICEKRSNQTSSDIKEVENICKRVLTVDRRKQWSISNIVNSGILSKSFLSSGHSHKEMMQLIRSELANNNFDIIHVETFYIMQNLPDTVLPIVLAEHNIEYSVYEKYVNKAPLALRPLLNIDIAKIKKEEKAFWKKATKLIAVSKDDAVVMRTAGFAPTIIANGVDVNKFVFAQKNNKQKEKKILYIGDFKWIQNQDSAKYIIEEIWPQIELRIKKQELRQDIKLWFVGRNIPTSIKNLTNNPNIIFDEDSSVKPTEQIFQDADVLLAPIRIGGGTSYKILESMSCGTPVVTMPMSAEGIEAKEGEHLMVGENTNELADKTVQLLNDDGLCEKIAKNARELIKKNYTWEKIAGKLDNLYESII